MARDPPGRHHRAARERVFPRSGFPDRKSGARCSGRVAALKQGKDLIVIAPEWAEPLARNAFTDSLMPIADVARPDEAGYPRAIEVSALGNVNPLIATWPVSSERRFGKFVLRTRTNPAYEPPLFVLTDHAVPPDLSVSERGPERRFEIVSLRAAPALVGEWALGPSRVPPAALCVWRCGGGLRGHGPSSTIRVTARAVACGPILRPVGLLTLKFAQVPLGDQLYGYIGFSFFRFRDHGWPPVSVSFAIDGVQLGTHSHLPEFGWQPFRFSTAQFRGSTRRFRLPCSALRVASWNCASTRRRAKAPRWKEWSDHGGRGSRG